MKYSDSPIWQAVVDLQKRTQSNGQQVLGNFSYFQEKCQKLEALLNTHKPSRILEVGFNCGHTAAIMSHVCPAAELYCFDIADRLYMHQAAQIFTEQHVKFKFIVGDSKETLPSFFSSLSETTTFDFALIDGDHTFEAVTSDLTNVTPHITPGGLIMVDDLDVPGILDAVEKFPWENFRQVDQFNSLRFTGDRWSTVAVFQHS